MEPLLFLRFILLYIVSMNIANISYAAQAGTTAGSPYPYTWFALFENYGCIGGTGNTLALIVAILILSRKKGWKELIIQKLKDWSYSRIILYQ